jgi:hypothetical protein
VDFDNAEIKGVLNCRAAKFIGHPAFSGDSMKVASDVWFSRYFSAIGGIRITRATIGGNLDCRGAGFDDSVRHANASEITMLDATRATIDGDALIGSDFANKGPLSFFAANIGGIFELSNSESSQKDLLDLRDAKVRILSNQEKNWPKPKNLQLEGFVFNELGSQASLDPKTQIEWLRLQSPFVTQPYEQMATVFRNMSYQEESLGVSIAESWDVGVRL